MEDTFGEGVLRVWVGGGMVGGVLDAAGWVDVCYRAWSQENADVVCRQSGFFMGAYASKKAWNEYLYSVILKFLVDYN